MSHRILLFLDWLTVGLVIVFALTGSTPLAATTSEQARRYTRGVEFDFAAWTANAFWDKFQQAAVDSPRYTSHGERKRIVSEYLRLTDQVMQAETQISLIYSNPDIKRPEIAAAGLHAELDRLNRRLDSLAPLAEAVLQEQVSTALGELGLTFGGQPVPPVLYRVTPLPLSLIVSPREKIQTDASISLLPDLGVEQQASLEGRVDQSLGVSSLVVPVGGLGSYPTMVMRSIDLTWQVEVVAHEWIHNYLTLRPLGANYSTSPELRTMNETTASLAGKEIRDHVLRRYHPEYAQGAAPALLTVSLPGGRGEPQSPHPESVFDFRAEMHATRLQVDSLLADGKVAEAEVYMETRRRLFWDNGYPIRKLNQAYFAFYGAYADVPGGAAGEDPVGPAVVALRARSASLKEFLDQISWMNSFEDLKAALGE